MKKIFLIIIINLILIFAFCSIASYIMKSRTFDNRLRQFRVLNDNEVDISDIEVIGIPNGMQVLDLTQENIDSFCGENRERINENYTKAPIIILGCSYAYGHGLKKEESFPYLLSELTQRPVYDYAFCGSDLTLSVNQLFDNMYMYKELAERLQNSEYIIYIYTHDQINRLLMPSTEKVYNHFSSENKTLKQFLNKFFIVRNLIFRIKLYHIYRNFPDSKSSEVFLKKFLSDNLKELKKKIPNAKIIFIIYDEKQILIPNEDNKKNKIRYETDIIRSNLWKELEEQDNIKVVHTKDLVGFSFGEDYILLKDFAPFHPNAKVWELFTPLFAKEYIKE